MAVANYTVTVIDIFDETEEYDFSHKHDAETFAHAFVGDCETVCVSITNLNTEEVTVL